jgi:hypothetical protein
MHAGAHPLGDHAIRTGRGVYDQPAQRSRALVRIWHSGKRVGQSLAYRIRMRACRCLGTDSWVNLADPLLPCVYHHGSQPAAGAILLHAACTGHQLNFGDGPSDEFRCGRTDSFEVGVVTNETAIDDE